MSKLSRRCILQGVAGAAVVVPVVSQAAPHPAAFPLTHDADLELHELRRAIDAYQAAVRFEMSIEGTPGHAAAVAESDAREAVVDALVEAIHERTPTSMRDIALRAEALRQFFFGGHQECINEWTDGGDYAYLSTLEPESVQEASVLLLIANARFLTEDCDTSDNDRADVNRCLRSAIAYLVEDDPKVKEMLPGYSSTAMGITKWELTKAEMCCESVRYGSKHLFGGDDDDGTYTPSTTINNRSHG